MIYILSSIFCYDVWFYLSHVILHHPSFYEFHKEHHKNIHPRFMDTYVADHVETIFQGLGTFMPILFYTPKLYEVAIVLCFLNIRGMCQHDDRTSWITSDHHLIHHRNPNYNFGQYWIDWTVGTAYPRKTTNPEPASTS